LITDVFRSCPLLCTIHRLINFTLASVEKVPAVPAVLDKGHQSKLAQQFPNARLIYSGGSETNTAADLFETFGISRSRIESTNGLA
jgi:hypothetical protein